MTSDVATRAFESRQEPDPSTSGSADAFLQLRLRLLAKVFAALFAGAWTVNAILNAMFYAGFEAGLPNSARSIAHLAMAAGWALLWATLRRKPWTGCALGAADTLATFATASGLAAMIILGSPVLRSELVMSMAMGHVLVLRAAVLPSTVRRTALLGILAELLIVLATHTLHRHTIPGAVLPTAMSITATVTVWALLAISTTSVISAVIYGLRQRMHEVARFGQYTLESKVGEGGMGSVYKARHALLRRPTAIKLVSAEQVSEEQLAQFEREVQATAKLSHPNIVSVYDYGRSAHGVLYYAMEYVHGIDLQRLVTLSGPMPEGRVLNVLKQAADALLAAHDSGLVHRDVKPSNMILQRQARYGDQVKLVDFGLVKDVAWSDASRSDVLSIKGTPLYMAPETIQDPKAIDPRTDLYSLGAVGYFLLTGSAVFSGSSVFETCARHLHEAPEPPSHRLGRPVCDELEGTLLWCLEKSPDARPSSAAELIARLCQAGHSSAPFSVADSAEWWDTHSELLEHDTRAPWAASPAAKRLQIDPGGRT